MLLPAASLERRAGAANPTHAVNLCHRLGELLLLRRLCLEPGELPQAPVRLLKGLPASAHAPCQVIPRRFVVVCLVQDLQLRRPVQGS